MCLVPDNISVPEQQNWHTPGSQGVNTHKTGSTNEAMTFQKHASVIWPKKRQRDREGKTEITMKDRGNNTTKNVSVYIERKRQRGSDRETETVRQAKSMKIVNLFKIAQKK